MFGVVDIHLEFTVGSCVMWIGVGEHIAMVPPNQSGAADDAVLFLSVDGNTWGGPDKICAGHDWTSSQAPSMVPGERKWDSPQSSRRGQVWKDWFSSCYVHV